MVLYSIGCRCLLLLFLVGHFTVGVELAAWQEEKLEHEVIKSDEALPSAQDIISDYYAAVGGEMALDGIDSMQFQAKFIAHGESRTDGQVNMRWTKDCWHYDFKTGSTDTTYIKTKDGKQFRLLSGVPAELTGIPAIKMEEIIPVPMQSLRWLDYEDPETTIVVKGLVKFRDKECYHVEFKPKDGNPIQRYFDKESSLLVKLEYTSESSAAAWVLSDYKQIEEVWIPMHRENYFSGVLEYEVVKEKVKIGETIEDKWFKEPEIEEPDFLADPFQDGTP